MGKHQRSENGVCGRRCMRVFDRLIDDLIKFSREFLVRHGLDEGTTGIQLHEGYVVKVWQFTSTTIAVPSAANAGSDVPEGQAGKPAVVPTGHGEGQGVPRSNSLPRAELYARVGLRMNRLLRHFVVGFGTLEIEVQEGAIERIILSPTFRPDELRDLARLIAIPPLGPPQCPPQNPAQGPTGGPTSPGGRAKRRHVRRSLTYVGCVDAKRSAGRMPAEK